MCRLLICVLPIVLGASSPGFARSIDEPVERTATGLSADDFHATDDQLRDLVSRALERNPGIRASWAESDSMRARVAQVSSLPDPTVRYRYFVETPETRVGPQEHMLELSQGVPWGGKLRLQAERAESSAESRAWEAQDVERRTVADLKRAYFEAAYLQEALRVNDEEKELLRRFESIALKRYATGQGIQQVVVKVQTEISRLEDRRSDLRERLEILSRRIAMLTALDGEVVPLRPIVLPFPRLSVDREELERVAVAEHPGVRAAERRIEADRAWAARQRLESKPDLHFGLGYTSVGRREDLAGRLNPPEDNGQDILGFTVGIRIPVHRERIRAAVAEARESERGHRDRLASVRDRLRYEVRQATIELDSLSERGRLYLEVIIPQAEESLASAEAAYTTDRLGFLDLLDAERVLFQSRLAYHRILADLWIALADVEFATARPFPPLQEAMASPSTGRSK